MYGEDMTSADRVTTGKRDQLEILGLQESATWDEITRAHRSLVSDLTPGPDASHRNVALALSMLEDVNRAFASLRVRMVA